MEKLKELFLEIQKKPAPKGFPSSCEDLDILVYEYADNIAGFVDSYLSGQKINASDIHVNNALDQEIETCIAKIKELQSFKQEFDYLAKTLIEAIQSDSST